MCVWQSQAPAGMSKFTGIAGCEAFAKPVRARSNSPAAVAFESRLRRVSMELGDSQQLGCVAVQNRFTVGIAQARRRQNMLDRGAHPRKRIIGTEHDLARANLRRQMPQAFRGEYQRVEVKLLQVFA